MTAFVSYTFFPSSGNAGLRSIFISNIYRGVDELIYLKVKSSHFIEMIVFGSVA